MNTDWWRGAVIYQIYSRSFLDTNGDGLSDLPGVTARLDHVAALAADAIWLCPFFMSPQRDSATTCQATPRSILRHAGRF